MYSSISEIYETIEKYNSGISDVGLLVQCALGSKIKFKQDFTIQDLFSMTRADMTAAGFTETQQIKLFSMQRLAQLHRHTPKDNYRISSANDAAAYLSSMIGHLEQEHFVALFLNTKNLIIKEKVIFIGSLNACIVHPREIFREAIKCSAASIIVSHNHPSGSSSPSPEDISLTTRLSEAGEIVGIEVIDHIIIGNGSFTSLKEKGYI